MGGTGEAGLPKSPPPAERSLGADEPKRPVPVLVEAVELPFEPPAAAPPEVPKRLLEPEAAMPKRLPLAGSLDELLDAAPKSPPDAAPANGLAVLALEPEEAEPKRLPLARSLDELLLDAAPKSPPEAAPANGLAVVMAPNPPVAAPEEVVVAEVPPKGLEPEEAEPKRPPLACSLDGLLLDGAPKSPPDAAPANGLAVVAPNPPAAAPEKVVVVEVPPKGLEPDEAEPKSPPLAGSLDRLLPDAAPKSPPEAAPPNGLAVLAPNPPAVAAAEVVVPEVPPKGLEPEDAAPKRLPLAGSLNELLLDAPLKSPLEEVLNVT